MVNNLNNKLNSNWITGFTDAEGCFSVGIYKSKTHKVGYGVILQIIFIKNLGEKVLFNNIKTTLDYGNIIKYSIKNIIVLSIFKFKDTYYKMITFFTK